MPPLSRPEELARLTRNCCPGVSRFYTAAGMGKRPSSAHQPLLPKPFPSPAEEETLAACADQTFFLGKTWLIPTCWSASVDMADQVISAEDSGCEIRRSTLEAWTTPTNSASTQT